MSARLLRLSELRKRVEAAEGDDTKLREVIKAVVDDDSIDDDERTEQLELLKARIPHFSDLFRGACMEPVAEADEIPEDETLVTFGKWIPNPQISDSRN
jgi:hypothetical protein